MLAFVRCHCTVGEGVGFYYDTNDPPDPGQVFCQGCDWAFGDKNGAEVLDDASEDTVEQARLEVGQ